MDAQKRDRSIDILRGIAVVLVIWGHVIQALSADTVDFFENPVFKVIYSFHMPLFMLISGYLFYISLSKRSIKEMMFNRIQKLLFPILIWNTINYAVHILVEWLYHKTLILSLRGFVNSLCNLWFLWAVLAASIIVTIAWKCLPGKFKFVGLLLFSPLCLLFPYRWQVVWMYPYFIIGFLWCKYKNCFYDRIKKFRYFALPVYLLLILFYDKRHYIYISEISPLHSEYGFMGQIGIDLYRWGIGLVGSITMALIVEKIINVKGILERIMVKVEDLGKNSLQIYVLQSVLLEYLFSFFYQEIVNVSGKNVLTYNAVLFQIFWAPLLTIFFCFCINKIVNCLGKTKTFHSLVFR